MTFTTKDDQVANTATVEPSNLTTEQNQFINFDKVRKVNSTVFDHTYNGLTPPAAGAFSERLTGSGNEKVGLAKSLSVMPGDKIDLEVFGKYLDVNSPNINPALVNFANAVANSTSPAGTVLDGMAYSTASMFQYPFIGLLTRGNEVNTAPKAYLNYLVFDRNFVFNLGKSGYKRLTTAAAEDGSTMGTNPEGKSHEQLSAHIDITEPGYVYIYLSNEEVMPVEVYFDDFKVTHIKTPVIQTDDYYPFGLKFNSYSRENCLANKTKLFQGQVHVDDLELNWDSYRYRNHQSDIGRFFNIDPMADAFYYNSPYAFSENKVTTHREMEGLEAFFIHGSESDNSMWKKDAANFIMRELKPYFSTDQTADLGFKWNGYAGGGVNQNWIYNTEKDRAMAARQLVSYILKNRKQGQEITLVGHSHGGNVAIQAARILFEKHNTRVNIVNFNTPAFNGANDPENPWDNFGIDEMLHFFTDGDYVAGPASGSSRYSGTGSNVNQIELKNPLNSNFIGTAQHRFQNVNWQEVLSQFQTLMDFQNSLGGSQEKKEKPDADAEARKKHDGHN